MTPEEQEAERKRKMAEAMVAQPQSAAAPVVKDPGGFGKAGSFKEGSGQVTEGFTRYAVGVGTLGMSEIPIGGKSLGSRAGDIARGIDNKTQDFLRKLDPTNTKIQQADASGVEAAREGVQGVAAKAAGMATDLRGKPVTADQVVAIDPGQASVTQQQGPITAAQVLAERVQAQQAQAQQMTPAQVAQLQQMQTAQINRGEDQQVRTDQISLAQALQAQAAGTGPSVAEAQLQRQNEAAIRAQMAASASARGGNVAMAQRQAAQNIAGLQAEAGAQAAALRIQEQATARDQLRGVLGDTRQTDATIASQQAQLVQETGKTNVTLDAQKQFADALSVQEASRVNATLGTDVNKLNASNVLAADTTSAELALRADQSNQTTALDAQKATALNNINTDQFNGKALDEMARFKTDTALRADTANQAANLQAKGMTLDSIAKFMGLEQQSLQALLTSQTEALKIEQDRLSAQKKADSGMGGNILSTVGTIIAMCFPAGTLVSMMDGSAKPIEEIDIGDFVSGGAVLGTRKALVNERLYNVDGVLMTGSHAVFQGGVTEYAKDVGVLAHMHVGLVYNIVTSTHRMWVNGIELGDDTIEAGGVQCH